MNRFQYHLLPASLRLLARRICFLPIDIYECITDKRPQRIPLRRKIFAGCGNHIKQGEKFLAYFQELAGLKPEHSVMDIGCGIGRMAVPFTRFLNERGSYEGLYFAKSGIDWCNKHISAQYPNIHFQFTGLDNRHNNKAVMTDAGNFVFPYDDDKFDFVFSTMVFTQLMPNELEHLFQEISRVMKPEATCLMSFYIVNCESEDLMIRQPTPVNFPVNKGFYRLSSSQVANFNVAYDEEWLLEKLEHSGFKMETIKYGQWCGRGSYLDYQDLLICSKVYKGN